MDGISNSRLFITVIFDVFTLDSMRKTAVRTIIAGLYFYLIEFLEANYLVIDFQVPTYIFYLLGYVLVMLLYFKVGSSYYRWYEGRKYWSYLGTHGKNLANKMNTILPKEDKENRKWFCKMITNHAYSLRGDLRGTDPLEDVYEIEPGFRESLKKTDDIPNHITSIMAAKLNTMYTTKQIAKYQYLNLNKYVNEIVEINEQCRGIREIPTPASYTQHLRIFLTMFTLCLPFGFIHDHDFIMTFVMMVIYGAYEGCIVVSEEIEQPFGTDKYDIPLDDICYSLKKHTHQLLQVEYK